MKCFSPAIWCPLLAAVICLPGAVSVAGEPGTTLGADESAYRRSETPYMVLRRGEVTAVVVDNSAVDDGVLAGHRAGYSGVARLTHAKRAENLFVPNYAGLNYEHIHDGTTRERDILFEPRRAAMELRIVDEHTAELYQPPTPTWKLESCTRYRMLDDGTIEMTYECIPRAKTFRNGYVGLFWANYIHQPESLDIHFLGTPADEPRAKPEWIRGVTPAHGVKATHVGLTDNRTFAHDDDFPLSLVFHRSDDRFAEPWYYGVSHGMAYLMVFRESDGIRLTQSPSGGGQGNPAWDFQWVIPDYEVGSRYQMKMHAVYVPFTTPDDMAARARREMNRLD